MSGKPDEDGTRYRWMGDYASLFVAADVTTCTSLCESRRSSPGISPMGSKLGPKESPGTRAIVGDGWAVINLTYRCRSVCALQADQSSCGSDMETGLVSSGSADMRESRVQVGEPEFPRAAGRLGGKRRIVRRLERGWTVAAFAFHELLESNCHLRQCHVCIGTGTRRLLRRSGGS